MFSSWYVNLLLLLFLFVVFGVQMTSNLELQKYVKISIWHKKIHFTKYYFCLKHC